MNLFILDSDPIRNAQYHVDKHVVKMILEATQLMCTQFHLQGINAPYKATHKNHPCSVFCRLSLSNFLFVHEYASVLHDEFQFRYGKTHKSGRDVLPWILENMNKLEFPKKDRTSFALAMPEKYRSNDCVKSYRSYYEHEKSHLFSWSKRNKPEWLKDR